MHTNHRNGIEMRIYFQQLIRFNLGLYYRNDLEVLQTVCPFMKRWTTWKSRKTWWVLAACLEKLTALLQSISLESVVMSLSYSLCSLKPCMTKSTISVTLRSAPTLPPLTRKSCEWGRETVHVLFCHLWTWLTILPYLSVDLWSLALNVLC